MLCIALLNDYKKNLTYIFSYFNLPYIKRLNRDYMNAGSYRLLFLKISLSFVYTD